MMMKTTDFRLLPDGSYLWWMDGTPRRCIHVKRSVYSPGVIIIAVGSKDTAEMLFMQHDHVIETLAPDTPNHPFRIGILPRTSRGYLDLFDPHLLDTLLKIFPVDAVAVAEHISRRFIPRKGFHYLLRRPLRRGVFCDVEVHDAPALVGEEHKHKQHPEGRGRHRKEIAGDQVLDMVVQKRLPGWRGWLTRARTILLHGRFGDSNAEFLEFADNARGAPRGIGLPHVLDELAHLFGESRSPRRALLARRRQWSLNRFFCQAITVRGCTKVKAWCQSDHRRESQAQSKRSVGRSLGRGTLCL